MTLELARAKTENRGIWFSFSAGGVIFKGMGIVVWATDVSLKIETAGAHSLILWNLFKPLEVEYFESGDIEATYLPEGLNLVGGFWRILSSLPVILLLGELVL